MGKPLSQITFDFSSEEEKDVKTAIGAARAKSARGAML